MTKAREYEAFEAHRTTPVMALMGHSFNSARSEGNGGRSRVGTELRRSFAAFSSYLIAVSMALTTLAAVPVALAGSSSIGTSITFERDAYDLGKPKSTKVELNGAHTFDNGVVLGASLNYSDTAFSDSATDNLEGTIGYRLHIDSAFSIFASVGVGERFQTAGSGDDFPYYVLRAAADLTVSKKVTWNALAFRYRDAFDADNEYMTPQLATGATFKLTEQSSISGKVEYNWKDWRPDSLGLALGFKYAF